MTKTESRPSSSRWMALTTTSSLASTSATVPNVLSFAQRHPQYPLDDGLLFELRRHSRRWPRRRPPPPAPRPRPPRSASTPSRARTSRAPSTSPTAASPSSSTARSSSPSPSPSPSTRLSSRPHLVLPPLDFLLDCLADRGISVAGSFEAVMEDEEGNELPVVPLTNNPNEATGNPVDGSFVVKVTIRSDQPLTPANIDQVDVLACEKSSFSSLLSSALLCGLISSLARTKLHHSSCRRLDNTGSRRLNNASSRRLHNPECAGFHVRPGLHLRAHDGGPGEGRAHRVRGRRHRLPGGGRGRLQLPRRAPHRHHRQDHHTRSRHPCPAALFCLASGGALQRAKTWRSWLWTRTVMSKLPSP